jgi:hypothetical protein
MITEQEQYTCVQSVRSIPKRVEPVEPDLTRPQFTSTDFAHDRLFEFAANAPVTLAERHPRLTVLAISAAFLSAAIAVEIEYLSGSGYFWR